MARRAAAQDAGPAPKRPYKPPSELDIHNVLPKVSRLEEAQHNTTVAIDRLFAVMGEDRKQFARDMDEMERAVESKIGGLEHKIDQLIGRMQPNYGHWVTTAALAFTVLAALGTLGIWVFNRPVQLQVAALDERIERVRMAAETAADRQCEVRVNVARLEERMACQE